MRYELFGFLINKSKNSKIAIDIILVEEEHASQQSKCVSDCVFWAIGLDALNGKNMKTLVAFPKSQGHDRVAGWTMPAFCWAQQVNIFCNQTLSEVVYQRCCIISSESCQPKSFCRQQRQHNLEVFPREPANAQKPNQNNSWWRSCVGCSRKCSLEWNHTDMLVLHGSPKFRLILPFWCFFWNQERPTENVCASERVESSTVYPRKWYARALISW